MLLLLLLLCDNVQAGKVYMDRYWLPILLCAVVVRMVDLAYMLNDLRFFSSSSI